MTFPKARLAVAAVLFVSWLGFLLYLVIDSRLVVVSKPQLMIAQFYVVAEVKDAGGAADPAVRMAEVLWPPDPPQAFSAQQVISLPDVSACTKAHGYEGAGKYLLPLVRSANGHYEIAAVPRVQGYPQLAATHATLEAFGFFSHRLARRVPLAQAKEMKKQWAEMGYDTLLTEEEIRIYLLSTDVRQQVNRLIAEKK